jgi:hypothetical protein
MIDLKYNLRTSKRELELECKSGKPRVSPLAGRIATGLGAKRNVEGLRRQTNMIPMVEILSQRFEPIPFPFVYGS